MRKSSLVIFILLLALCLFGLFTGGLTTMLILIGSAALFAILFYFIVRPKNKQKTDANYQKAVKQSQELQKAKQNAASKKKNSSFKVIEGGKK